MRALILLGHGSHYNPDSSLPIHFQVGAIRRRGLFDEVLAAFWKEEPNLCHAIDLVESEDVFIIPYFISNGYFTEYILPRELEIEGPLTKCGDRRIFYSEPVGMHPAMTEALCHCVETVIVQSHGPNPNRKDITLIIVGHGTTQNENSAQAILKQVELLKQRNIFAEVVPAFIEEEPFDKDVLGLVKTPYVVVVPFFISDGLHSREDVPVNMGFVKKGEEWKNPVLNPCGKGTLPMHLWYTQAVGTGPWMIDVILDRVRNLEDQFFVVNDPVKNTLTGCAVPQYHRDFFNEIRTIGEVEFGQLLFQKEDAGLSVRHIADRGAPVSQLKTLKNFEDARELGCFTEGSEYRPLRSASTLKRGWIFCRVNESDLTLFVDLIYPGAVMHRSMFQHHHLRIRSYEEVALRQSGIYAVISGLKETEVCAFTKKICNGCVKYPVWSVSKGEKKSVIQKTNAHSPYAIPCPEPCSYWIDLVRQGLSK